MMLSCPGCNTHYSLDERKLPARGARLTCRECGRKFKVKLPASGAEAAPAAAPPAAPSPAAPSPVRPELSDSSGSAAKPVSCPKCGHFFIPFERTGVGGTAKNPAASAGPAAGSRGSILLVEDQEYFAELTKDALGEGFRTTVVSTVSEARELLGQESFNLVILDLSLEEGQDGAQVLHLTSSKGIPVLIFTSRDETDLYGETWEALRSAGATDILIKGMNVEEDLKKKVDDLLGPRS